MTSRPTPLQLLVEARALIADRQNWTVAYEARAFDDTPVDPLDHRACKFCALGALRRVRRNHNLHASYGFPATAAYTALTRACLELNGEELLSVVNDWRGHAAALAVYDAAIETLKGA